MKKVLVIAAVLASLSVAGCKLDFRNMPGKTDSSISHNL